MSPEKLKKRQRQMKNAKDMPGSVGTWASPKSIIGEDYIEDIPVREAFIGILRRKEDTARAIKSITSTLPGFEYLKRCSGSRLLLAFVKTPETTGEGLHPSFATAEDLKIFLINKQFPLNIFQDTFEIGHIPERAPRTRAQFNIAHKQWPVKFHPDPSIEAIMSGNFFNPVQLEAIEACMRLCIEVAEKSAVGNEHCNGSAVILNPADEDSSRILAVSTCRVNEHPMWHAAMLAVDLVARARGAGAWELHSEAHISETVNSNRKREFPSDLPLFYPASLSSARIPTFDHSVAPRALNKPADNDKDCPYLCTNYWAFLLQEPCPLCAMALLHSRVSMVFYGVPNNSRGVLGTKILLHTLPGLNHRYKVWSGILETECKTVMEKLIEIQD